VERGAVSRPGRQPGPELLAHRLDVIFGRSSGFGLPFPDHLTRRLVRLERLGLLMLEDHLLAAQPTIPLSAVAGLTLDTSAGNVAAPEWVQLATELVVDHGAIPSPEHHPGMPAVAAAGADEIAYHLRATGWPIISLLEVPAIPGAVVRPFTSHPPLPLDDGAPPRPEAPGARRPGSGHRPASTAEGWWEMPASGWLASAHREIMAALRS
jgi:hypothetical protein